MSDWPRTAPACRLTLVLAALLLSCGQEAMNADEFVENYNDAACRYMRACNENVGCFNLPSNAADVCEMEHDEFISCLESLEDAEVLGEDDGHLRVRTTRQPAALNAWLHGEGIALSTLAEERRNLEEVFMEAVQ